MSKIFAVMEMCGNFSHTLCEFESEDSAAEFVMTRALDTAKEQFKCDFEDIPEVELEEELELALSYYNIEKWEV